MIGYTILAWLLVVGALLHSMRWAVGYAVADTAVMPARVRRALAVTAAGAFGAAVYGALCLLTGSRDPWQVALIVPIVVAVTNLSGIAMRWAGH